MKGRKTKMKGRKVIDCREFPSEINCTITISGLEKEVFRVAHRHALEEHGHKDTAELRKLIKTMMRDEDSKI